MIRKSYLSRRRIICPGRRFRLFTDSVTLTTQVQHEQDLRKKVSGTMMINFLCNLIDGGFFVFGDLAVKKEGKYRLHFSLFEIVE